MTEQELTQARADLEQLDIEQLRCGVMIQLLKIEALTKERDELKAAAKLAMDALVYDTRDPMSNKDLARVLTAITALRQAGVQ